MDPDILNFLDGLETVNGLYSIYNTKNLLDSDSRYGRRFIMQTAGSDEHWERDRSESGISPWTAPHYKVPVEFLIRQGLIKPDRLSVLDGIHKSD